MKIIKYLLVLTFLAGSAFPAAGRFYNIDTQDSRKIVITVNFDKLQISDIDSRFPNVKRLEIAGLPVQHSPQKPELPILTIPLLLPSGKVTTTYQVLKEESFQGVYPATFIRDFDSNEKDVKIPIKPFTSALNEDVVKLKRLGLFRDYNFGSLIISPVRVSAEGIAFIRSMKITIRFGRALMSPATFSRPGEADFVRQFVANKNQVSLIAPTAVSPGTEHFRSTTESVPFNQKVRIIVKEDGIYHVTPEDLLQANVDVNAIDPTTFRITNKGKDVPFFLVGETDHKFDGEDYFDFWGESNRQTFQKKFSDLYKDPFSDENVYWLEWGGQPGQRIVEESGSIVATNPTQFNPAPYYRQTVHVEQDNFFERLGVGSTDHLSYTRDLWFFDSGVKAVGKKQYPFQLLYPDSSSFNPVRVDAMFSGKSFGGFSHKASVWINNSFVGDSPPNWFGQDTARISNRLQSSVRNLDLVNGQNTLEVQLTQPPTFGSDIVLLNWFEVTYDKKYRAFHNFIRFRRPSVTYFPNVSLYQFELDGFTSSNVEIFKKNISRIVNFRLDVDKIGARNDFRIIFQDNVLSDDVEYIALTPDQKKKPLRIELVKPFDPENPSRTLRDVNNSADYLIISHSRFLDKAIEYRDYRRETGFRAEAVDVQNIYDEFNHGIKSPLAIQDFIKYVFFNWDQSHRLKYVLLLGDANFNYKSSSPSSPTADLVPTLFYQTFKFGASATDYPYGLISGKDLIPDVFVGRVPANTNADVLNFLNKVKEYEQTPKEGQWRNQSLFISGNDAFTFEFENRNRPLFRVQNSRVLEVLLPQEHSSFRLNTVKDKRLSFDPNFGGTTDLIDHFDDGVFYMNFVGHGGGAIWADVQLFNLQDVDRLHNKGMYPFITSMTCFTGSFDNPGNAGLAQKLVLAKEKGAIGLMASSGLGWAYNDYAMLWGVDQFLFDRTLTTGEAVMLGKVAYLSTSSYFAEDTISITRGYGFLRDEMVHQYNLIGDPAVKLVASSANLKVQVDKPLPQPGDTLNVTVDAPFASGKGYVEISDNKNEIVNRLPLSASGTHTQLQITLPASFPEGTGKVRAYLATPDQDASGVAPIGVNFAVLDSFSIEPPAPRATDSVFIKLHVNDAAGISRVYVTTRQGQDSIAAVRIAPNLYQTIRPVPPLNSVGTVFFNVFVENNSGNISAYRNLKYSVADDRPDLFIFKRSMKLTGEAATEFQLSVGNAGNSAVSQIPVVIYDGLQNFRNKNALASQTISIAPHDSIKVKFPFPLNLSRPLFRIYAEVDPQKGANDFNRGNNVDSLRFIPTVFNVTPALGSTFDLVNSDTISTNPVFQVYFPPGSVDQPTAVRLELRNVPVPTTQKGLIPISLLQPDVLTALNVRVLNPAANITAPYLIKIKVDPNLTNGGKLRNAKLFQQENGGLPWVASSSFTDSVQHTISAVTRSQGLFAPFANSDFRSPNIELTVNGRPVKRRAQVSATPTLYLVVEDEGGINIRRDRIQIRIDDQLIPDDKLFIPDSLQSGNILGITAYPELERGNHTLSVQVQDVNGNTNRREFNLLVSDVFDVHVFGNYPNPFTDQTIFSYFVSPDVLDELEIRIYTLSGRLIRRITEDSNTILQPFGARTPGYNELIWDGKDEDGVDVANGVYFAVIRAKYQGQIKETTLKVARLR